MDDPGRPSRPTDPAPSPPHAAPSPPLTRRRVGAAGLAAAAAGFATACTGGSEPPGAVTLSARERGREVPPGQVSGRSAGPGLRASDVRLDRSLLGGGTGARRTGRLATGAFAMVGFTWTGPDPTVRYRTRTGGAWGPWRRAVSLHDGPDRRSPELRSGLGATDLAWAGRSDGIEVEVAGRPASELSMALLDPERLTADRVVPAAPQEDPYLRGRAADLPDAAPKPELLSRAAWGADESWRDGSPTMNETLKQVHVHHTVSSNDYLPEDVPGLLRGMYRYHTANLGWSDLGYNFLVDRYGRTWVGRAGGPGRKVRGAHTLGFNDTSTGVAVIGNHEQVAPSREVLSALVRLAAWKLDKHGRRPAGTTNVVSQGSDLYAAGAAVRLPVIDGHRDTNQTACPGSLLHARLQTVRNRAQKRVDRFSPP